MGGVVPFLPGPRVGARARVACGFFSLRFFCDEITGTESQDWQSFLTLKQSNETVNTGHIYTSQLIQIEGIIPWTNVQPHLEHGGESDRHLSHDAGMHPRCIEQKPWHTGSVHRETWNRPPRVSTIGATNLAEHSRIYAPGVSSCLMNLEMLTGEAAES